MIDAIVDAVDAAGGTPKRITDAMLAARVADDEQRAGAHDVPHVAARAHADQSRARLAVGDRASRCARRRARCPRASPPKVRRTPDRYTVQIGPVGLSFSWIRGRSNSIADGQLLVIEWSGQLGEQHAAADPRNAMPAFEHVLQPHATSPEDWQWRRADIDLCCYTTRDLAEQCVASVVRRLPVSAPSQE